jgi:virginiamycin B lyase
LKVGFKTGRVKLLFDFGADANTRWYVCTPKIKRPRRWYDARYYGVETEQEHFRRYGGVIAFSWVLYDGDSGAWEIGWLDTKTLRKRVIPLPQEVDRVDGIALGPNGAMAYVENDRRSQELAYAPAGGKARFLMDVTDGSVNPKSLELTADTLRWKSKAGEARSVALAYTPPWWGSVKEFAIPTRSSKPAGIAAGPDGALWFTEYAGNRIGRIGVDGQLLEFKVPTARSLPDGIVAGADGALWFTEGAGNKVGRITTDGTITEFPVPTAKSGPGAITAGPDGALWFAERLAKKVGRITTDGQISEFKVPGRSDGGVLAITAGPDGALWLGVQGYHVGYSSGETPHRIVRMAPDGTVTAVYPVKDTNYAGVIAPGPDGALWYGEPNSDRIGRITTGGAITDFEPPTFGSPVGIVTGPDGALWFAEQTANKLGRVTTDGTFSEFRLPQPQSGPFAITTGPDGALWFTEYSANRIGRMPPSVARP